MGVSVLVSSAVKVPTYNSPLVSVCNGFVFLGYPGGGVVKAGNQASAPLRANTLASMCFLNLAVYIVDGLNITTLPLSTGNVTAYAPAAWVSGHSYSSGNFVTDANGSFYECILATSGSTDPSSDTTHWQFCGTAPTNCLLCCNWRGRLVLAGDNNNPQNFYMARVGQPLDWNYAATDPAAAVAGNLSESGQIGEPIVALIPYTDDYMLIGCSNSLWMLQGDPADGGSIVRISDQMGLVSPNSWCVDPAGTLYFIARGGLYSVRPIWEFYQPPQLLSGETYDQYFQGLINDSAYISMQWDADAKYMHIFSTPTNLSTQGTHLIFDQRNGGLWPQQYPLSMGPTATCRYAANSVNGDQMILFGGTDGYIRQWTNDGYEDDGTSIACYAVLGPIRPNPDGAAVLTGVTVDYGEVAPGDADGEIAQESIPSWNATPNTVFTWYYSGVIASTIVVTVNGVVVTTGYTVVVNATDFVVTFGTTQTQPVAANFTQINQWNAAVTLQVGANAYDVTEGTPHNSAVIKTQLDRRQVTWRQRFRGGWFSLLLANSTPGTYFSFESANLEFSPGGRNRDIR